MVSKVTAPLVGFGGRVMLRPLKIWSRWRDDSFSPLLPKMCLSAFLASLKSLAEVNGNFVGASARN